MTVVLCIVHFYYNIFRFEVFNSYNDNDEVHCYEFILLQLYCALNKMYMLDTNTISFRVLMFEKVNYGQKIPIFITG